MVVVKKERNRVGVKIKRTGRRSKDEFECRGTEGTCDVEAGDDW